MDVGVFRLPMADPSDVNGLKHLLETGQIKAEEIIAVIAQTEGTGYPGATPLCVCSYCWQST